MRDGRRGLIDLVLDRSPIQLLFRLRSNRDLVALAYHDVSDDDRFTNQMEYLARHANVISAEDLIRAFDEGSPLPPRAVLITFDDGDRTVLERGMPILARFGFPAVLFPVAGLLGTDEPFWWTEVEELVRKGARLPGVAAGSPPEMIRWTKGIPNADRLAALDLLRSGVAGGSSRTPQLTPTELAGMQRAGMEIGNHSFTHPCLNRCDEETVRRELTQAHETLTAILGRGPRLFAYPSGDFHPAVPGILRELGYVAGFFFDHMISAFPPADRLAISRLRVNSTTSMNRFRTILSGLHPFIHHARGLS